jgi:hypothetical protein
LGSIGGALGLFSGFSLLAIVELFHWICKIFGSVISSKIRRSKVKAICHPIGMMLQSSGFFFSKEWSILVSKMDGFQFCFSFGFSNCLLT